jgi:PAS domain S-box-containing protein
MLSRPFTMIIQPAERARWMQWHQNIIAGVPEPLREAPVTYRDGRTGFVAVTADRLQLADASRYRMTTISDVTEKRRSAEREQMLGLILRSAPVVTFVTDAQGRITHLAGKEAERLGLTAEAALGQPVRTALAAAQELGEALDRALAGEEATARIALGEATCDVWLCPCRDASGQLKMVVGTLLDVTEQLRASRMLRDQLATITAQADTISRLLLPILPLWPGVLCVPLLSEAGEALGSSLKEELLAAVARSRARIVLLDLTGVVRAEAHVVAHLLSLAAAVRLLGAQALLTGLRPEVARALASSGADLSTLRSYPTLHEGLRACLLTPAAPAQPRRPPGRPGRPGTPETPETPGTPGTADATWALSRAETLATHKAPENGRPVR